MNLKEIKELIALMNENSLVEIEMERDGLKIRLRKGASGISSEVIPSELSTPKIILPAEAKSVSAAASDTNAKIVVIKSPMVGTFYRAPSPEAVPFVEAGSTIEVGQVVCIVEAMKLMNEIKSEVKGQVVEILVDDGQPVEFGQTLFVIEPA